MRNIFIIALLVILQSCHSVRSVGTRFHNNLQISGKTFNIEPYEEQKNSLEFKKYSKIIENKLIKLGAISVETIRESNYRVNFRYGIDDGKEVIESAPIIGNVGVGNINRVGGVGYGTSFSTPIGGLIGPLSSSTEYTRYLNLDIINSKTGDKEFEGKLKSIGNSGNFLAVSNCLIDAMFKDFPGESGKTHIVTTPTEDCVL